MKIIYNKVIPFKGFKLMNILGLVFSRVEEKFITLVDKRHEQTHTYQQYELLCIGAFISLVFCNIYQSWWYLLGVLLIPFIIYVMAWLLEIVLPPYHNVKEYFAGKTLWEKIKAVPKWASKVCHDAYHDNCFEREAYLNERNVNYFATRHWCGWVGYIIKDRKEQRYVSRTEIK